MTGDLTKIGQWATCVLIEEMPDNGIFACQPTDAVLDPDQWPIWTIVLKDGVVSNLVPLYVPVGQHDVAQMDGWTKQKLAIWTQFDDPANGYEIVHSICRVG